MRALKLLETISPEEYLEGEKVSPVKHEYVDGRVFALAGASDAHNRVAGNVFAQLWDAAAQRECRIYMSDMKVRALGSRFYYPDVMAVCDVSDGDPYIKEKPCLIVEVLSCSTAATDRREKVDAYLSLPTLYSYVLVDSQMKKVEAFTRTPEGWREQHWQGRGEVPFACLGTTLSLDAIYRGLNLPDYAEPLG
jgi:Uma2 family endonuclease